MTPKRTRIIALILVGVLMATGTLGRLLNLLS